LRGLIPEEESPEQTQHCRRRAQVAEATDSPCRARLQDA
jgi:hypothetical protein